MNISKNAWKEINILLNKYHIPYTSNYSSRDIPKTMEEQDLKVIDKNIQINLTVLDYYSVESPIPIEHRIMDMYGVDITEFEDPKKFTQHYCHNCGSQRCEGIGTEWFEGCKYKEHLKDYENFYG